MCQPSPFHRGDGNGDGDLDVSDAVCMLQYLFLGAMLDCRGARPGGGARVECQDAADANGDGEIDCSDAIFVFRYLFLGGDPPPSPGPPPAPCGPAGEAPGSSGGLGCDSYLHC